MRGKTGRTKEVQNWRASCPVRVLCVLPQGERDCSTACPAEGTPGSSRQSWRGLPCQQSDTVCWLFCGFGGGGCYGTGPDMLWEQLEKDSEREVPSLGQAWVHTHGRCIQHSREPAQGRLPVHFVYSKSTCSRDRRCAWGESTLHHVRAPMMQEGKHSVF